MKTEAIIQIICFGVILSAVSAPLASSVEHLGPAALERRDMGLDERDILKRLGAGEGKGGDGLVQYPTNVRAAMVRRGVVDFGYLGLWMYNGYEEQWFQLSGLSPD